MEANYEALSKKVDQRFSSENKDGLAGKFLELEKRISEQNSPQLEKLLWKLEQHERELRKCNILIIGLPRNSEELKKDVTSFLKEQLNLDITIVDIREVGKGAPKRIWVQLPSFESKQVVLHSKGKL